jgi:amino-acid N-acetyltransferase
MSTYTYRHATADDWGAVSALLSKLNLPLEGAEAHLPHFLLAFDAENQLAGIAGMESYGEVGLLRSVAVAEPGQGLGHLLVKRVVAEAERQGIRHIALLTTTAADFFPRFGFHPIPQSELPLVLQASAELQGACPATATAMILDLHTM